MPFQITILSAAALTLASSLAVTSYGPYRDVEVTGFAVVSASDVAAVTEPYRGRALAPSDLQSLADSLTEPCDRAALALCRADIPRSGTSGETLRLSISEGYVTDIEADAAILPLVRDILRPVLNERPLRRRTLEQAVANLDEVPGLTISAVRPERLDGDAYKLIVTGTYRRSGVQGLLTNRGSRRADPWRAIVVGDHGSFLRPGDRLQAAYLTRPESPEELSYGVLRYATAPTRQGTTSFLEINASESSPRTILDGRDASGSLLRGIFGLKQPLRRREGARLDLSVSFEGVRSIENEDGRTLFEDQLRVLRSTLFAERRRRNSLMDAQVTLSAGLDALDADGSSRSDGETEFLTLAAEGDATIGLGRRGFVKVGAVGQVSDSPLFFQEEFSVGGGRFGRGYDYGEVRGDSGVAAFVEVGGQVDLPARGSKATPYAYVDAGSTWNEGEGLSADGAPLWSAGAGLRVRLPAGFNVDYEAAMPLSDAPYTLDDDSLRHRVQISWTLSR